MYNLAKLGELSRFVLLALVIGCASACSKHKKVDTLAPPPPTAADSQAQSYGVEENGDYNGQVKHGSNGEVVNPMTAPANQTYYFDYDSNSIRGVDYEAMTIQANYLAAHPQVKVRLEGNTDNRGSREYNIGLGWRRAQAVQRFLEQHGVMSSQMDMVSYGKEHPVATGDSEESWQLNRRVELVYEGKNG